MIRSKIQVIVNAEITHFCKVFNSYSTSTFSGSDVYFSVILRFVASWKTSSMWCKLQCVPGWLDCCFTYCVVSIRTNAAVLITAECRLPDKKQRLSQRGSRDFQWQLAKPSSIWITSDVKKRTTYCCTDGMESNCCIDKTSASARRD